MRKKIPLTIFLLVFCFSAYAGNSEELSKLYQQIEHSYRVAGDAKAIKLSRQAVKRAEKIYGKNDVKTTKALVFFGKIIMDK